MGRRERVSGPRAVLGRPPALAEQIRSAAAEVFEHGTGTRSLWPRQSKRGGRRETRSLWPRQSKRGGRRETRSLWPRQSKRGGRSYLEVTVTVADDAELPAGSNAFACRT